MEPSQPTMAHADPDTRTGLPMQDITSGRQGEIDRLAPTEPRAPDSRAVSPQFSIGGNQYMFDVSSHSQEELVALLKRADEVASVASPESERLDIALILHGPDIGWFARKNYQDNKELVDLAARLDALEVIDMKICQQSMQHYGYVEDDIPAFIDRVPYAPDEMQRLEGSGYFTL